MNDFLQFPRTDFLYNDGGLPKTVVKRQLLTADELEACLGGPLIVEEKIDGSNVGLSFDSNGVLQFQGKTRYFGTNTHPQHHLFFDWGWQRRDALWDVLGDEAVLYGEWLVAKHTIKYTQLPDYFVGFDVYMKPTPEDPEGWFWTADDRNALLEMLGIAYVPRITVGGYSSLEELLALAEGPSAFGSPVKEGVYLRLEAEGRLSLRAKYVRPEFRDEHAKGGRWWLNAVKERNALRSDHELQG